LFSPWYTSSWKIAELALNNNHSLTLFSIVVVIVNIYHLILSEANCNQTLHEWCLLQPLQKLLMAKNKTTMSKSSDLLKLLKSSLKLQVQMICNLVHIMCVTSINILRFVMIGQRTPLVTLASDWLKVSANSSPL
jgi:hypothetical protein